MKRRRILQAGIVLPLAGWAGAWAQAPERNLVAGERKEGPGVAGGGMPLLVAPRRALVIGNSSYSFGPLKNPANDARAIGEELKRSGFEVTTGLDLPRREMLEAIRAYAESLTKAKAVGVFYFAGHGVQLAWRNYLLPTDAQIARVEDIEARCVDVNAVIDGIAKAANPMNVVILDACRENPFAGVKLDQKGLSQLDAPPGTLLAYATAPGNLASDGEGANGLYTEQLLRELKVPEARIEDVFKRVRLTVRRRSNGQQIPWESTSLEEDFWFLPPREQLRLAQAEAGRIRKAQEAERLWLERIAKQQRDEEERLRREAEAERARQERIARAQREEAERLRREADAERAKQEAIAKAQRDQAERLKREAEAEKARQEERERERLERLELARQEEADRAYQAEVELWERVKDATRPGPVEDYLRRYPSGNFAELAQLQLDAILAREGEKKVVAVSSAQNPYSQGESRADLGYKVGDSYSYVVLNLETRAELRRSTQRVTEITDTEVIFNKGVLILDRLGNFVKVPDGRRYTPRQDHPLEYAVGRKWRTRFSVVNAKGGRSDADLEFRVTRREKVTVPAGTFDCFVIEGAGWSFTDRGVRIRVGVKRWVAPTMVRRPIITEEFRKAEGRVGPPRAGDFRIKPPVFNNQRSELTAFSQS
jgi:uncharacterized caspase-like protein